MNKFIELLQKRIDSYNADYLLHLENKKSAMKRNNLEDAIKYNRYALEELYVIEELEYIMKRAKEMNK